MSAQVAEVFALFSLGGWNWSSMSFGIGSFLDDVHAWKCAMRLPRFAGVVWGSAGGGAVSCLGSAFTLATSRMTSCFVELC